MEKLKNVNDMLAHIALYEALVEIGCEKLTIDSGDGESPLMFFEKQVEWFLYRVTRIICIIMAGYLSLNTFVNFISKSRKEKYVMTPLSFVTAVCFWITAL